MAQEEDETSLSDECEDYACYTDEMKNKVDEICAKYELVKLSGLQYDFSYDEICSQAGTGKFCQYSETAKHDFLNGFLYDNEWKHRAERENHIDILTARHGIEYNR